MLGFINRVGPGSGRPAAYRDSRRWSDGTISKDLPTLPPFHGRRVRGDG